MENFKQRQNATKWIIGVATGCILVYLGIRHIDVVAMAIVWFFNLFKPLFIGLFLALIFNVPMSSIENRVLNKFMKGKAAKAVRPLSIVFALIFVFGIFIAITIIIVPELVEAVKLLAEISINSLDSLSQINKETTLSRIPFGSYIAGIDLAGLKLQMEQWLSSFQSGQLLGQAADVIGTVIGGISTFIISLVFSIYILMQKETLKTQIFRVFRVWLPARYAENIIYVITVCRKTFRQFIIGQATEAVVLGSLCTIGMFILRLPYAPMIGALVGVTALVPIIGAFVGVIVGAIMITPVAPLKTIIFVVFFLILQQLEGNLIYPRVVGSKIHLPAIWVLAAVFVGGQLAGVFGMFIGVPLASVAYALLKEATDKKELEILESNKNN